MEPLDLPVDAQNRGTSRRRQGCLQENPPASRDELPMHFL
jgi:hypothetical protein